MTNPYIELLKKCDDTYTNLGEYYVFTDDDKINVPEIEDYTESTDDVYDMLKEISYQMFPNEIYFQKVGSEVRGDKVQLPYTMGSMTECHEGELENWIEKDKSYIQSNKLDGCLEANTMVITDKGEISIEEICKNISKYKVLSVDINGQEEFKEIENYLIRDSNEDTEWYLVTLEDGKEILITGNHPVYLPKYNVYREVKDLIKGDYVLVKN